jgi:colicin import membrane protein
MPPNSRHTSTPGSWRAIALSILVHSLIVAAAVLGWFTWKHEPPEPQTLAIEASVVDERALEGVSPPPEPAPPEPEPQPEPIPPEEPIPTQEEEPPKPDPAEIERRQQEERAEAERQAREQAEREKQAQEEARLEAEKKEAERVEAEKQAAARAAAEKEAAEKKRAEEAAARKAAEEKARKAAEEKARQAREEELRRSLEAEERRNAARNSEEAARWHAQIISRVTRAWIRPPAAVAGVHCVVLVSQVPGGEVTSVRVDSCNPNDAALRESVEAAVLRASPLPTPPPGVPFERNLRLIFAPQ